MHQKLRFCGPHLRHARRHVFAVHALFVRRHQQHQLHAALCQQLLQGREVCRNLAKLFGRIGVQALVIVQAAGVGHIFVKQPLVPAQQHLAALHRAEQAVVERRIQRHKLVAESRMVAQHLFKHGCLLAPRGLGHVLPGGEGAVFMVGRIQPAAQKPKQRERQHQRRKEQRDKPDVHAAAHGLAPFQKRK